MRVIQFYLTESGKVPVKEFLRSLPDKFSKKIAWTLRAVRETDPVPTQYLKKLTNSDDIWEIRATLGNNTFRLLGFFDHSKLIILTNGFAKKSQKVPKQEIILAEQRKQDYYRRKSHDQR